MRGRVAPLLCALAALAAGCSSCMSNGGGENGTDLDAGTDTGTDTGTGDADADSDTDTDTGTGSYFTDAGPWDWEPLPEGEDCGEGCRQLTFEEEVAFQQWDVWENLLVYQAQLTQGSYKYGAIRVVNTDTLQMLPVPSLYSQYPWGPGSASGLWPCIAGTTLYYSVSVSGAIPTRHELVRLPLSERVQEVFWGDSFIYDESPNKLPQELDTYGDRLITMAGCGDLTVYTLCAFEPPWSDPPDTIIGEYFGGSLSIWGDKAVFTDVRTTEWDIHGYDFDTHYRFDVTDDDEYQLNSRMHGSRVAYQDFRFGDANPLESWAHSAVFVKDLESDETFQLTDGSAVAGYPDIHGDIVVWVDWRLCTNPQNESDFSCVEIFGHNLASGQELQITDLPGRFKNTPRVWGDKVFVDMKQLDAGPAIYVFDLPEAWTEK